MHVVQVWWQIGACSICFLGWHLPPLTQIPKYIPNTDIFSNTKKLKNIIYINCLIVYKAARIHFKKKVVSMWQTGGLGIDLAGAIGVFDGSRMPCYTLFLYPCIIIAEYIIILYISKSINFMFLKKSSQNSNGFRPWLQSIKTNRSTPKEQFHGPALVALLLRTKPRNRSPTKRMNLTTLMTE